MDTFYHNSPFSLKIAQSQIPNAGLGVYTLETIRSGSYIDEYCGVLQEYGGPYALHITENCAINANVWPRPYMAILNDCTFIAPKYKQRKGRRVNITPKALYDSKGDPLVTNCEFRTCEISCKAWIYATRDIPAGAELYVEYGDQYWK